MPKNRTERLQLRLSPTEKESLLKKAKESHMSPGDYILCLSEKRRVIDTTVIPTLILDIRRVGTNINQIAAVANSQKYINKPLLLKVIEHEKEIAGLLLQILEEVYNTEEHTLQGLEVKIDKMKNTVERMNDNGSS